MSQSSSLIRKSLLILVLLFLAVLGYVLLGDSQKALELPEAQTQEKRDFLSPKRNSDRENAKKDSFGRRWQKDASINGTIRDVHGNAIPNATICVKGSSEQASDVMFRRPTCTHSNEMGRYELKGLFTIPISYRVDAWAQKLAPKSYFKFDEKDEKDYDITLKPGEARDNVDIVLDKEGALISGIVHDISGGTISEAIVHAGKALALTDNEGKFSIWTTPGELSVEAWAEGYTRSSQRSVAPGPEIELFLTPESILQGRVVWAKDGEPVEGVKVWAADPSQLNWYADEQAQVLSDQDGRFRIDALEPGTYKALARTKDGYGRSATLVHLAFGEVSGLRRGRGQASSNYVRRR